jgi:hypothetical protein
MCVLAYPWDASGAAAKLTATDDAAAESTAAAGDGDDPACAEPPTRAYDSSLCESFHEFADIVLGHRVEICGP